MNRLVAAIGFVAALLAGLLSGCADDGAHRGHPPRDPSDYHGVPTDDRPPAMLEVPPASSK